MLINFKLSVKGFTLVELLVAISILGILSTIGLTVYTGAQRQARDARRIGDIKEIQKALEQHYALNRNYPEDIYSSDTAKNGNIANALQVGALSRDPNRDDDGDGIMNPYSYSWCLTPSRYLICAQLEEGRGNHDSDGVANICTSTALNNSGDFFCVSSMSN